jgi:hypothetical protein
MRRKILGPYYFLFACINLHCFGAESSEEAKPAWGARDETVVTDNCHLSFCFWHTGKVSAKPSQFTGAVNMVGGSLSLDAVVAFVVAAL